MITRKRPRERPAAPTVFEKIELGLKIATFAMTLLGLVIGGGWALYNYYLSGADGWAINSRIETKILPYSDHLRLLVVNVKSVNPRDNALVLDPKSELHPQR